MGQLSQNEMRRQESAYAGALAEANPLGDVYYVDSTNGADGNDGLSRRHPKATLVNALAAASAGDTIVLAPGGSETVTATVTVSLAGVKIVCSTRNPRNGYIITGAGSLDLMTVSAARVHIEGLKFTRTAGAGGTTAGILTTAAADGLTVRRCMFDYSALTSSWTNYGIELTDDILSVLIEDCQYLDCHRGVLGAIATGKNAKDWTIRRCDFWVGRATAFGIYSQPAGTGTLQGILVDACQFIEANGDGAAATDAWDGTNGTDAGSGPINFNAQVDRWLTVRCSAYTVANTLWENQQAINASAAGHHVEGFTHQGAALADVSSDTTHIESDAAVIESRALQIRSDTSDILSDTTIISSDTAVIESRALQIRSDTSDILSDTTIISSDTVVIESRALQIRSDTSDILSDTTIISSDTTKIESDTAVIESRALQIRSDTSDILSDTTIISSDTTKIESDAARTESDQLLMTPGYGVAKVIVIADNAIPNNSQSPAGLIATATGGAVWIEDIVVEKDATAMTGPTNLEITTDNVYGSTGAATPVSLEPITSLGGNGRYSALADSTTERIPFVLASGKKLYVHGDDAAGTSLGNTQFAVIGRALADGATLT